MNPEIDRFLAAAPAWQAELTLLRALILTCPLTEELKWGKPCYTFQGRNIVILQGFKASCALLFAEGALLADPQRLLEKPGVNTQAARRIRFTSVRAIAELEPVLRAYVAEAIAVREAGREVIFKEASEFEMPAELQQKCAQDQAFKAAFSALTPGRQRGYFLHFSAAKQAKTRESRIEKWAPHILKGKGFHDR